MRKYVLTGRERTLLALDFKPIDRPPVVGGFVRHPSFIAESAGVTVDAFWEDKRSIAFRAFRNVGADVVIGLILPDRSSKSGAQHEIVRQEKHATPEDVVAFIHTLPAPSEARRSVDVDAAYREYLTLYEEGQSQAGDMLWIPNTFSSVCQFQNEPRFGAENYYMALALYPEDMKRFFEWSGEIAYQRNVGIARAIIEHDLPRVMWLGQDACDNKGPYIRPDIMNDIYIRYVKRSLQPLKDAGVTIIWHSDGNIMPIAQYLLDAGIDGFQGLQETIDTKVDISVLSQMTTQSGRKPIIVGSVSSVTTLPFGSPDDVRADVMRCRKLAEERGGGWLINSSSSIGPEVPIDNVRTLFRTAAA
ncbi:MAG: uroporphyrinogen decarboxylase family protein [Spirochaetota bacterium]